MTCLVSSHLYDRLQWCGGCISREREAKKVIFIFLQCLYTSVYKCHPYTHRPGTHIALRPLNQDENKLMIYVLLNIHEGNPVVNVGKKLRKQKCCWCWNLDRKFCKKCNRIFSFGWLKGNVICIKGGFRSILKTFGVWVYLENGDYTYIASSIYHLLMLMYW